MSMDAFTPYYDKMYSVLEGLSLKALENCNGKDTASLRELSNDDLIAKVGLYSASKISKIAIGSFQVKGQKQFGLCTVFADTGYDLPLFVSYWDEDQSKICWMVDIMPTVDDFIDEDYRAKYIETQGEAWDRFAKLPGICPEDDNALRSLCSINYSAGQSTIENEGMRLAVLAPHTSYLKAYIEFIPGAEQVSDDSKKNEVFLKTKSLQSILKTHFRAVLESQINSCAGSDKIDLLTEVFF
jgi:hypothetical protein